MSMTTALLAPGSLLAGSLAMESGEGSHVVWHLPIPEYMYGVIAITVFMLLLGITWTFRNAAHTLMTQPDVVEHGHGRHRSEAASHQATPGGDGSAR